MNNRMRIVIATTAILLSASFVYAASTKFKGLISPTLASSTSTLELSANTAATTVEIVDSGFSTPKIRSKALPSTYIFFDSSLYLNANSQFILPGGGDGVQYLGASGSRWADFKSVIVSPSGTAAWQPSCSSSKRGAIMVVEATAGNPDTLQVCVKAAADTYAWQTVFTAP